MSYSSTVYINPAPTPKYFADYYPGAVGDAIRLGFNYPEARISASQTTNDYSSYGSYSLFGANGNVAGGYNNTSYQTDPFGSSYLTRGADFSNLNGYFNASNYLDSGFNRNVGGISFGGGTHTGNYITAGHGNFDAGGYNYSNEYFKSPFVNAGRFDDSSYNFGNRNGISYSNNYGNSGNYFNTPFFQTGSYNNFGNSSFAGRGIAGGSNYQNSGSYLNTPFFNAGRYNNTGSNYFSAPGYFAANNYQDSDSYFNLRNRF